MRPRIVLYNPRAVFWTMPLALLAVGSAVDRRRFDVVVVDGRLDDDEVLLHHLEDALCLGVTVLTGAPLGDALRVSRLARQRRPGLPIVWGGWHPSLFPAQVAAEAPVTAVVVGQGEATFAEIVDRLADGGGLDDVPGCWTPAAIGAPAPARPMVPLAQLPPHDYDLIQPERYFAAKTERQLDYTTSQGCRFRCSFCADPAVFGRGWTGLPPERVVAETIRLWRRYGFTDLGLQDETFFTSSGRVAAIVDGWLRAGTEFSWYATLRADQGRRLDDEVLRACRRSGLRRVVLGVESGHQPTLDRIRKDISLDDVWTSAHRLETLGVGASIGVIVGFPGESRESVLDSLRVATELRAMSPDFEVNVFSYKPYPGNPLSDELAATGGRLPQSLEEWAAFDYVGGRAELLEPDLRTLVDNFRFYQRLGFGRRRRGLLGVAQRLARWRVERHAYAVPVERWLAALATRSPQLS